jgi:RNA polymerase sigma-70 factor (ECF subfamily)
MRDGPEAALPVVSGLLGELDGYHLAHAAHADLCRRLGRNEEAIASYEKALALSRQEPERRFLQRRIDQLGERRLTR